MNWIKQAMDDREITVEEMAEILDLAESTVKGYYQGWRKPGKNIRLNIIRILDLDEEEINELCHGHQDGHSGHAAAIHRI